MRTIANGIAGQALLPQHPHPAPGRPAGRLLPLRVRPEPARHRGPSALLPDRGGA
ncbi:MAG: hypothetical protein M0C28_20005 [Candidatus Moduliflexus flocculans]|nr:hypothetical protein [Candidatus Moduliflexus flocculans]